MLRIHTLGGLSVRDDGRAMAGAAVQPRRMAVLAVLARAGQRGVTREKLLGLLWPDADEQRGPRALAQALYALRKDLGGAEVIVGLKELRLDPSVVTSDVADFDAAVAAGALEQAVALRGGPFLDGFHVPGAAEFERWAEEERQALEHQYTGVLERLARAASDGGHAATAAAWWRRLAALDPLNGRYAVGLIEALAATGDRGGALRHARVYEVLLEQELDLPPDREVVALANRLRREAEAGAVAVLDAPPAPPPLTTFAPPSAPVAAAVPEPAVADDAEPARADAATAVRAAPIAVTYAPPAAAAPAPPVVPAARRRPTRGIAAAALVAGGIVAGLALGRSRSAGDAATPVAPLAPASGTVLAIGRIASYRMDSTGSTLATPVADLLATNLARATGVRVVSAARIYELLAATPNGRDTSAGAFAIAARRAGATELIDGTLYVRPGGQLRLDLRRTDLASGDLRTTHTIEGRDVFALVDSGTARLVSTVGGTAPAGSVADVTTRSLVAYRLYSEGLERRAMFDVAAAARLFTAALAEDSTFALAAYGLSESVGDAGTAQVLLERAVRLSANATDRERLMIRAGYAFRVSSPAIGAIAETLAVRYPDEVEGHLYRGLALVAGDEFAAAVPHLERVIRMDSTAVLARRPRCAACDAVQALISIYVALDSLPGAEAETRRWMRLQPTSAGARVVLAAVLDARDRPDQARAALREAVTLGATAQLENEGLAAHYMHVGDYAAADRLLLVWRESAAAPEGASASWLLALGRRQRGMMREALTAARRARETFAESASLAAAPPSALLEAQILLEMGRLRESAALFDSVSRWRLPTSQPSALSRNRAWAMTHAANALALLGDTARLAARADTIAAVGATTLLARDHRLHHHVRGLLLAARGRDAEAAAEFRAALGSPTLGYTRTNLELGRTLLRLRRPQEAVAVLRPALHAPIEGSALYVNRTELRELLAQAWDAAGQRDSAAVQWAIVARDWAGGDPPYAARAAAARARAGR